MNDLADVHAPLIREDGTVEQPIWSPSSRRSQSKFTEIPSSFETNKRSATIRRQIADFGIQPKQLNLVSLVCMYTFMGLSDQDIAFATGLELSRVQNVKMLDAYQSVYEAAVASIINEETDDVRHYIMANAKKAATEVVNLMQDAEFETVRLAAAKDVLDRSGQRPIDIVEHHMKMDGELRIVVTRNEKIPEDIELEEVF